MTESQLRTIVKTNIRRFRHSQKWTQAELAEKLDISINFLSDIENGKKWISPASIVKFASVLGIEPYELFRPSGTSPLSVTALLSKYNDEVIRAIGVSIDQIYNSFQTQIDTHDLDKTLDQRLDDLAATHTKSTTSP